MDASMIFEAWRHVHTPENGRGLAWFLALQFCQRYYASHGIVPHLIDKEGLGYYGLQLDHVACTVNAVKKDTLGRMTIAGDVENWRTGGPGDHGLATAAMCRKGVVTDRLVEKAIRHMGIPSIPTTSHAHCRHKRWGRSFEVVFEVATILALRHEGRLEIWNCGEHVDRLVRKQDGESKMIEHPGAFWFCGQERRLLVAGDGRVLAGKTWNLWEAFMNGASTVDLARRLERRLGLRVNRD